MSLPSRIVRAGLFAAGLFVAAAAAQEQPGPVTSRDVIPGEAQEASPPAESQAADGSRHGQPIEQFAVVPGTKFLVRLEGDISTKRMRKNQEFRVRTLEPLEAGQGHYLPAGALITGHVSRVESAGTTGRAKIWLTFDELQTRFGKLPIVAEVTSV